MPPSVTWIERPLMLTCGNGVSRTRPGEHRRRTNLRNCQDPLVLVSCGVWRASVCLGCSAAVPSCALFCFVLMSCLLKICHLARKTQKRNRGDGEYRTRPGQHRRGNNLRNCQDPLVLVSCGSWRRCVCSVSSFLFFLPIALSRPIIKARARDVCPARGEESSKPSLIHRASAPLTKRRP